MTRHRAARIWAAIALLAPLLVACAPQATPTPTSSAVSSPQVSATPTPTQSAPIMATMRLFGGDCDKLLRTADVSDATGGQMTSTGAFWSFGMLEQEGGLRCTWVASELPLTAEALAVPASVVSAAIHELDECGEASCRAATVADGVWLAAVAPASPGSDAGKPARDMLAKMVASVSGQVTTIAHVGVGGRWVDVPDCETIVAGLDAEAAGLAKPITIMPDFAPTPSLVGQVEAALGLRTCYLQVWLPLAGESTQRAVSVQIAPGGAVAHADAIRARIGATEATEFGEYAVMNAPTNYENYPGILGEDGVNMIFMEAGGLDPKPLLPVMSQIFALLGS